MTLFDAFRYDGKRAVVVGGATGMGAAAAELLQSAGAEVVVMDYAEVSLAGAKAIHVNLAERDSIDAAFDQIGGPVDALLSCAGVADGTPGIEKINFIGHRHLIDRLFADDLLPRGSAIGFISSAAGLGWESNLPKIKEYLATPDFDSAAESKSGVSRYSVSIGSSPSHPSPAVEEIIPIAEPRGSRSSATNRSTRWR